MITFVDFFTPKHVFLKGFTLSEKKSDTWYIFIHGLGGNAFSLKTLAQEIVKKGSTVLLFNNRGHDIISRIKKQDIRKKSGYTSFYGGAAHEIFTDCVDDIEGAVQFAQQNGAKKIYLVGHSTGSQKAVYYLTRHTNQKKIAGVILLSPLSDFAGVLHRLDLKEYETVLKIAKALVDQGSPHVLLPSTIWPEPIDAQRFLSLYTPVSTEDIFSYPTPDKETLFSKLTIPTTVIFGQEDEFADRPISEIQSWFDHKSQSTQYASYLIAGANHGFDDHEKTVAEKFF